MNPSSEGYYKANYSLFSDKKLLMGHEMQSWYHWFGMSELRFQGENHLFSNVNYNGKAKNKLVKAAKLGHTALNNRPNFRIWVSTVIELTYVWLQ